MAELKSHELWWHGPPWLAKEPVQYPEQPNEAIYRKLRDTELRSKEHPVNAVVRVECLEEGFNSYRKLIRVVCWIKRLGFFY